MPEVQIRKRLSLVEEIFHEGGPIASKPLRRAAALAVIRNPYAGGYVEMIEAFMDDLKPLGLEMAQSMVASLGGDPKVVEGYGKGAIVGPPENSNTERSGTFLAAMPCVRFWRREGNRRIDQKSWRPGYTARHPHHSHQRLLRAQSF